MEGFVAETNRDIIPDTCISFSEMSDYVSQFSIEEYNNIMEEAGINELLVFEATGNLIVYEGEELDKLKAKFNSMVTKIWGVIKSFWEKVISSYSSDDKKLVTALKKVKVTELPDKKFGITHTFFNPLDIKYAENAGKFAEQTKKVFSVFSSLDDNDKSKGAYDALEDQICTSISGVNSKSNSSMKSELKSKLIGDKVVADKAYVAAHIDIIIEGITAGKCVAEVKKAYNEEKKVFTDISKQVNELTDGLSVICNLWGKLIVEIINTMHACYSVEMDVLKRQYTEYRMVAMKVVKASGVKYTTEAAVEEVEDDKSEDNSSAKEKKPVNETYQESFDKVNNMFK